MLIVDSQVHVWGANTPERPWPKRGERMPVAALVTQETEAKWKRS